MTPKMRSLEVVGEWQRRSRDRREVFTIDDVARLVEQAIIAAVEAERESCAEFIESCPVELKPGQITKVTRADYGFCKSLAKGIRARSNEPEEGNEKINNSV